MELEKDEFRAWLQDRTTRKVWQYLRDVRETLKEGWAQSQFLDPAVSMRRAAQASTLLELLNLSFEDIDNFYRPNDDDSSDQGGQ